MFPGAVRWTASSPSCYALSVKFATVLLSSSLASALLFAPSQSRAEGAPQISAKEALRLAEEALAPKNPSGSVYISSLVLQQTAMVSGKRVWTVQWSESVEGSKAGSKEVGLEIGMNGSVVHLIKGRGTSKPQPSPH